MSGAVTNGANGSHAVDPSWAKQIINSPCYGTWRGESKKWIIMQLVFAALVIIACLSAYIGCFCV